MERSGSRLPLPFLVYMVSFGFERHITKIKTNLDSFVNALLSQFLAVLGTKLVGTFGAF